MCGTYISNEDVVRAEKHFQDHKVVLRVPSAGATLNVPLYNVYRGLV